MFKPAPLTPHHRKLAKFIVYVCRHGAQDWNLHMDPGGWLEIDEVLTASKARKEIGRWESRWDIIEIVQRASEGRLEIDEQGTHVRALQGHSHVITDESFQAVTWNDDVPRWLIHGTDDAAFLKIRVEGISPMTRQHVHLAQSVAVVHDYSTVHIYLDKYKLLDHRLKLVFNRGDDHGAILCRSVIPPSCFECAWHIKKEIDLLHRPSDDWVVAAEVETNTRWKQIRLGKWTHEYNVWYYSSDDEKRRFPIKPAPDSSDPALPKRQFLRKLSAWRVSLHQFHEWKRERDRMTERHSGGDHEASETSSECYSLPPVDGPRSPVGEEEVRPTKRSRSSCTEGGEFVAGRWQSSDSGAQSSSWWQSSDWPEKSSWWQSSDWPEF